MEYYVIMEGVERINALTDKEVTDGINEMQMRPVNVYGSKDRARRQVRNDLWNEEDPLEQRYFKGADGGYSVSEDDDGQLWLKAWKIVHTYGDSE